MRDFHNIKIDNVDARIKLQKDLKKINLEILNFLSEIIYSEMSELPKEELKYLIYPWLNFYIFNFFEIYNKIEIKKKYNSRRYKKHPIKSLSDWNCFFENLNNYTYQKLLEKQIFLIRFKLENIIKEPEEKINSLFIHKVEHSSIRNLPIKNVIIRKTKILFFGSLLRISQLKYKRNYLLLHSSRLSVLNQIYLYLRSKGKIIDATPVIDNFNSTKTFDLLKRSRMLKKLVSLNKFKKKNNFFKTLAISCILNLPLSVIEARSDYLFRTKNLFKFYPKFIFTTTGQYYSETLKYTFIFSKIFRGKIIIHQHGGGPHYGKLKCSNYEEIENFLSDIYLPWGNSIKKQFSNSNIKYNMPSIRLSQVASKFSNKNSKLFKDKITYVCGSFFPIQSESFQIANINKSESLKAQKDFIRNCPLEIKNNLLIRNYPYKIYGKNTFKNDNFEENNFHILNSSISILDILKSKLIIFDYISTMFAEAISCDRPSIIYIKGINNYPWTKSGKKFIEDLTEANIIFNDEKKLFRFINENKINEWWQSKEIIYVKKWIKREFYQSSNNYIYEWEKFFYSLLKNQNFNV